MFRDFFLRWKKTQKFGSRAGGRRKGECLWGMKILEDQFSHKSSTPLHPSVGRGRRISRLRPCRRHPYQFSSQWIIGSSPFWIIVLFECLKWCNIGTFQGNILDPILGQQEAILGQRGAILAQHETSLISFK